jgi:hypothetical protein
VTAKPIDATAKPIDATGEWIDATAKPIDATGKPIGATEKPIGPPMCLAALESHPLAARFFRRGPACKLATAPFSVNVAPMSLVGAPSPEKSRA